MGPPPPYPPGFCLPRLVVASVVTGAGRPEGVVKKRREAGSCTFRLREPWERRVCAHASERVRTMRVRAVCICLSPVMRRERYCCWDLRVTRSVKMTSLEDRSTNKRSPSP